jgi:aryl-alcohol dehydrogenase-like predicted oxidoreductase/NAD-dependent dihydropyrimidine dehydrogenase PreA subunit
MKKVILGNTGYEVTEICFGCLPFGPLQKNLPVEEAAEVLSYGLDLGINFIDTAQMYKTYDHIKLALAKRKDKPIIATKSTAAAYEDMEIAIKEALEGMGVEHLDIFHLHSAKAGTDLFEVRKGALECLKDYKKKGVIKTIGVSTHNVKLVEACADNDDIDVVFPLINKAGRGIINGTIEEMKNAISKCEQKGKGIYLMKALGGGTLIDDYEESMSYARNLSDNYSIAIGMISKEEVLYNVKYFNGEHDLDGIIKIRNCKKVNVSQNVCTGCKTCVDKCHSGAISMGDDNKSFIDQSKCIQCGYCIAACPAFAIRMI